MKMEKYEYNARKHESYIKSKIQNEKYFIKLFDSYKIVYVNFAEATDLVAKGLGEQVKNEKKLKWMWGWKKIRCKKCKIWIPYREWKIRFAMIAVNPVEFYFDSINNERVQEIVCPKCSEDDYFENPRAGQFAPTKFYKKTQPNMLRSNNC